MGCEALRVINRFLETTTFRWRNGTRKNLKLRNTHMRGIPVRREDRLCSSEEAIGLSSGDLPPNDRMEGGRRYGL